jgi:hypothetical protein
MVTITRLSAATPPKEEEAKRIIDSLAVPYQDIGGRWPKERRLGRIVTATMITTLLGLGYLILFSSEVFKSPVLYAVAIWIGVSLVSLAIFTLKYNAVLLSPDEKVFIIAYELITELRQYPIVIDMTKAANDLDYVTGELESNWTLGFPLAKEALSSITDFVSNLRFKLLPAFRKGKTEDVKLSVWTLAKLCSLLIDKHPKVSEIEAINMEISNAKLPEFKQSEKVKFHVKMRVWIANHSAMRWVGIAGGCVLVGTVIIALGNFLGHPAEGFSVGVGSAITLFVGFLFSPRLTSPRATKQSP